MDIHIPQSEHSYISIRLWATAYFNVGLTNSIYMQSLLSVSAFLVKLRLVDHRDIIS